MANAYADVVTADAGGPVFDREQRVYMYPSTIESSAGLFNSTLGHAPVREYVRVM